MTMGKMNIRREDMVFVIAGKDRDRTTARRVLRVFPKSGRVLVEGANLIKKHTKPNPQQNVQGGIVEREAPLHVSNLMLKDPETGKPTRVGRKKTEDGKSVRIARGSGAILDKG
jgi:large subunit ribosomal protein L24